MRTKGYLIVKKNGSARFVKSPKVSMDPDEIAIALEIDIPDAAFRPHIEAKIHVNREDIIPTLIDTGVLNNLSTQISGEIGLDVKLLTVKDESND